LRRARALAVACLLAAPGWAGAEWTTIGSTEAITVEIDPDLVRAQGPFTMVYTRATFTVPRAVDGKPDVRQHSQMQLHAVDCAAGASTIVGVVLYAGPHARGEMIEQTIRPRAEWSPRPAPPGSLAAATIRVACDVLARRGTQ
jgi:hypothetical protein